MALGPSGAHRVPSNRYHRMQPHGGGVFDVEPQFSELIASDRSCAV
jgi:hypothetical protein